MSPQLKSFEGPDVQLVLDRIRRELGPDAKINGAEKIRVGGVLGFFAKEHYRVLVEAPDVAPPASPPASALATSSNGADVFSAMAEATDDVNEVASTGWTPVPRQPVAPTPVAQPPAQPPPQAPAPPPPPPPPLVRAAEADDGTDSFDTVLSRVAHTLGDSPADSPAGGATGGTDPVPDSDPGAVPGTDDADDGGPDIAARAALYLAETTGEPADPRIDALHRAGLDPATVAAVAEGLQQGAGLEALLLATFGRLDPVPVAPRRAGSLLVVVGQGAGARSVAMALASEIGGDPAAVSYCSLHWETRPPGSVGPAGDPLVVGSAEEAAELAPGWRRSGPAVVAVDCAVTSAVRSWATAVIGALRPTAVWGVVDATAKSEDVSAWAGSLGGLDALAVENLDATVSPAASLAAGIPVARLDGRPANAARWTATIVDRVTQP